MMENITIGQYVPGKSWIYRMDPRVKILLVIGLMVLTFLIKDIFVMLGFLGFFILMTLTTGVPFLKMLKGIKSILYLMTFTFVLQTIYTTTGSVVFEKQFSIGIYQTLIMVGILLFWYVTKKFIPVKFIYFLLMIVGIFAVQLIPFNDAWFSYTYKVYDEGLIKAVLIFIRVVMMLFITSMLTFTTMNTDINNGVEALLSPLKIIKFPVGVLAMLLSLTLRFIPTLVDETSKIMKAQASRGVEFSEGNLSQKIKQIVSLLVPMFVISFRRADELANAMEARGYVVGAKRTKLDELKLRLVDYLSMLVFLALLAGVICARIYL